MSVLNHLMKVVTVSLMAIVLNLLSTGFENSYSGQGVCLASATCFGDLDQDGDVDGVDLAAAATQNIDISSLAGTYGSQDCIEPDVVVLIGSEGGTIVTDTNITVNIPAGALSKPTLIGVSALNPLDLAIPAPGSFSFAAGVTLFSSGETFALPAQVILPPSMVLQEGQQVAVVQAQSEVRQDGIGNWILVDRAVHLNGVIQTRQSEYFPGLTGSGKYTFIVSDVPFAYIALTNIVSMASLVSISSGFITAPADVTLYGSNHTSIASRVVDQQSVGMIEVGYKENKAWLITDSMREKFGMYVYDAQNNLPLSRDEVRSVDDQIKIDKAVEQIKQDTRTYVAVKEENVDPGPQFLKALEDKLKAQLEGIKDQIARDLNPLPVYASSHLVLEKDRPGTITANVGLLKDTIIPLRVPITFATPIDNVSFTVPAERVAQMILSPTGGVKKILDIVQSVVGNIEAGPVTIQIMSARVTKAKILQYNTADFVPILKPHGEPFPYSMETSINGDEIAVTLTTSVLGDNVASLGMNLPASFKVEVNFDISSEQVPCSDDVVLPEVVVTPSVETFVAHEVVVSVVDTVSPAIASFTLPDIANRSGNKFLDMAKVASPDDLHELDYSIRVECPDALCNGLDDDNVSVSIDGKEQTALTVSRGTYQMQDPVCEERWQSECAQLSNDIDTCIASGWPEMCQEGDENCFYCDTVDNLWQTNCSQDPCEFQSYTFLDIQLENIDLALDDPLTPDLNEGSHILYVQGLDSNGNLYHDTVSFTLPSVIWEETWNFDWGYFATCQGHPVTWNEGYAATSVVYGSFLDVHGGLWEGWSLNGSLTSQECLWMDEPYWQDKARTAEGICLGQPSWVCTDQLVLTHYDGDYINYRGTIPGINIPENVDVNFKCDVASQMISIGYGKVGTDRTSDGYVKVKPNGVFDISLRDIAPDQFKNIGFTLMFEKLYPKEGAIIAPCHLYVK